MFPQVKILLLAESKIKNLFTCGNKIKDFILLGKTKIFSLAWENKKKIFFQLRKQSYRFLFAWENQTIFSFAWENKKNIFSVAETKLQIFICLGKQNINILLNHVLNEPP